MIRYVIAGVELFIKSKPGIEIRERNPVAENFFVSSHRSPGDHQIQIEITDDPIPEIDSESILFDADAVWTISRNNHYYRIFSHPPDVPDSLWDARFDHEFLHGRVYCGNRLKEIHNDQVILYNPFVYPLDQILMMNYLALIGGVLVHAAGWHMNDSGWMFAGKSGAGKSTISNLIVEQTGATFLSDDRIVVRKIGSDFLMYGTPWPGDAGYAVNKSVPLKGLFFLSKGAQNDIKRLTISDAIARLMPVVSIPWYDRGKVALMMGFCDALMGCIPMYELTFKQDKSVVAVLEQFINEPSF